MKKAHRPSGPTDNEGLSFFKKLNTKSGGKLTGMLALLAKCSWCGITWLSWINTDPKNLLNAFAFEILSDMMESSQIKSEILVLIFSFELKK